MLSKTQIGSGLLGPFTGSILLWGVAVALCACQSGATKTSQEHSPPTKKPAKDPVENPAKIVSTPFRESKVLLELGETAYGKTLAVEEDTVYMLTDTAFYRFSPRMQTVKVPLDLGYGPAFTSSTILYWSEGSLRSAPKRGGASQVLAKVPHRPQQIVASEDRFAWLNKDEAGRYSIQVLKHHQPYTLYQAQGDVSSLVMIQDWVFFVERLSASGWRIGGVPVGGGGGDFSLPKSGRIPSMLAASNKIFYYDLPSRSVRSLSPDFLHEEVIARDLVCSPLAVVDNVLCARVEGVFRVLLASGKETPLSTEPLGLVTAIAGSKKRVAWLNDSGKERLTLRTLSLAETH